MSFRIGCLLVTGKGPAVFFATT